MNKQDARDYLPLVQALADGKTIQIRMGRDWVDVEEISVDLSRRMRPVGEYRIKPDPLRQWYRVALMRADGVIWPELASAACPEGNLVLRSDFLKWVTGRIEYEVEA